MWQSVYIHMYEWCIVPLQSAPADSDKYGVKFDMDHSSITLGIYMHVELVIRP